MRHRILVLFLVILTLASPPAQAGDDVAMVGEIWHGFVEAVRRGDYRQAHNLFTPASREALTFQEFIKEYGPATRARDMVVSPATSLSSAVDGEWGEIRYTGIDPATAVPYRVAVSASRDDGRWGLVAARNEGRERVEAMARNRLMVMEAMVRQADARDRIPSMLGNDPRDPLHPYYRFRRTQGVSQAIAQQDGLRHFHTDREGRVWSGSEPKAPTEGAGETSANGDPRPVDTLESSSSRVLHSEGSSPRTLASRLTEWPEPPALPPGGVGALLHDGGMPELSMPPPLFSPIRPSMPEPDAVTLPDIIQ